jgi:hypothetical protein
VNRGTRRRAPSRLRVERMRLAPGSRYRRGSASDAPSDPNVKSSDDGDAAIVRGAGSCPAKTNAADCPTPPSLVTPLATGLSSYWVGCELTSCATETACTVCTCIATAAGAMWDCLDAGDIQPDTDAEPTPYCALSSGPIDASDIARAGSVERCTAQYPTSTAPLPESPGWQCCAFASVPGAFTRIPCMPNDAGAYA